ncbi:carbohydrate ABC transporter permease, partial [Halomonas sp. BBD48]|nr:carbohydrate ABC transporter permease [Halomonas sp. BBD48]
MPDSLISTPEAVRKHAATTAARRRRRSRPALLQWRRRGLMAAYIVFVLLPIYWLLNMSFQSNTEILSGLTLWPENFTTEHYVKIFTNANWYMGYVNSITYVLMNMLISIAVALPAAYAFSRYQFIGDKHLFFWLLTNLMAPPAVFLLPYFQLYYTVGLFDT